LGDMDIAVIVSLSCVMC